MSNLASSNPLKRSTAEKILGFVTPFAALALSAAEASAQSLSGLPATPTNSTLSLDPYHSVSPANGTTYYNTTNQIPDDSHDTSSPGYRNVLVGFGLFFCVGIVVTLCIKGGCLKACETINEEKSTGNKGNVLVGIEDESSDAKSLKIRSPKVHASNTPKAGSGHVDVSAGRINLSYVGHSHGGVGAWTGAVRNIPAAPTR